MEKTFDPSGTFVGNRARGAPKSGLRRPESGPTAQKTGLRRSISGPAAPKIRACGALVLDIPPFRIILPELTSRARHYGKESAEIFFRILFRNQIVAML